MNPNEIRRRMAELVDEQPSMRGSVADDLRRGRNRLRTRRGAVALGTSAFTCAALIGAYQVYDTTDKQRDVQPVVVSDATILRQCKQAGPGALDPDKFGPGTEVLTSDTSTTGAVRAVIRSGDRKYWADCWLWRDYADGPGTVATYRTRGSHGPYESWSANFEREPGWFTYLDRFPREVARVELDFEDGPTVSAEAVDGFVAFERRRDDLPDDDSNYMTTTLYDSDGDVLATTKGRPERGLGHEYDSMVPRRPINRVGNPDPH